MRKYILFIVLVAQFISCKNQSKEDFSDVIIHNANIYSLNWSDPSLEGEPALDAPFKNGKWYFDAQAIAIKNNLIQFVGSDKEVQKYIGKTTKIINANKAIVIPGLIESHGHLQELGEKNEAINLEDLTKQQILDLIIKRAKETPKGEWIIASGWDEAVL